MAKSAAKKATKKPVKAAAAPAKPINTAKAAKPAKHEPHKLLSTKAAAKKMNLSVHTVRIFIRTGVLKPSYSADRVYFFTEEDCDWYNKNRREPGRPKGSKMNRNKPK